MFLVKVVYLFWIELYHKSLILVLSYFSCIGGNTGWDEVTETKQQLWKLILTITLLKSHSQAQVPMRTAQ